MWVFVLLFLGKLCLKFALMFVSPENTFFDRNTTLGPLYGWKRLAAERSGRSGLSYVVNVFQLLRVTTYSFCPINKPLLVKYSLWKDCDNFSRPIPFQNLPWLKRWPDDPTFTDTSVLNNLPSTQNRHIFYFVKRIQLVRLVEQTLAEIFSLPRPKNPRLEPIFYPLFAIS